MAYDMNSADGTYLNGRHIEGEVDLADNDRIEIGESRILYTSDDCTERESAWNHWKKRGERGRSTIVR